MPIDAFVPGDPRACRDCADRLEGPATAVAEQSTSFVEACWTSESEWQGSAGDEFRERISGMNVGASGIVESARTAAGHLRVFADGLETARARMRQAAEIADRAGLRVESDTRGTYDLVEIKFSVDGVNHVLRMKDSSVRQIHSFRLRNVQAHPRRWGLVYNGILHSVASGTCRVTPRAWRILKLPAGSGE